MIREHWEGVEDNAREYLDRLRDLALPQKRRLTEREQLQRYLSYSAEDFRAMQKWLAEKQGPKGQAEWERYVNKMERLRAKYG